MRSGRKAARWERRQFRRLTKGLSATGGSGEPARPPPHVAKDFLGAAVTLAIIGAILLEVTNGLASRCGTGPKPRAGPAACSGLAAFASHAHGAVTLGVAACGGLAVIAFIWYMCWGYRATGRASENQHTSGA